MSANELYIGNIDQTTTLRDLRDIFQSYGIITRCEVRYGGKTQCAMYGFVGFESKEDAERARQKENGRQFHGRRLIVQFTKTKPGEIVRKPGETKILPGDRYIGLENTNNGNSNEQNRSRSRNRDDSRDRYRRQKSSSYSKRSTRDRSRSDNRRRKRDHSRSSSNHKSRSKRSRLSSNDDKRRTSHSYRNKNSKKH